MFNMQQFLKDNNISFLDYGKNSSFDYYQSKCIFCNDSSSHLGWHKTKGFCNCWRCGHHSLFEVCKILHIPIQELKKYETRNIILEKLEKKQPIENITLPGNKLQKMHKDYLIKRGFNPDYLEKKYKLQGTGIIGDLAYRIIIPIFYQNKLISYQGRDITRKSDLRYFTFEGVNLKDYLYNIDNCKEDWIIITEGVFKVFKLNNNTCCTFGAGFSNEQIFQLKNYKKVYIYFDNDSTGIENAEKLCNILDGLNVEVFNIQNDKNADDLNDREIKLLFKKIKNNL